VGNRVARVLVGARRANNYNAALVGELKRWNRKLEGENQRLFTARAPTAWLRSFGSRAPGAGGAAGPRRAAAQSSVQAARLQPAARRPLCCHAHHAAPARKVYVLLSRGGTLGRSALCRGLGTGCRHASALSGPAPIPRTLP